MSALDFWNAAVNTWDFTAIGQINMWARISLTAMNRKRIKRATGDMSDAAADKAVARVARIIVVKVPRNSGTGMPGLRIVGRETAMKARRFSRAPTTSVISCFRLAYGRRYSSAPASTVCADITSTTFATPSTVCSAAVNQIFLMSSHAL